MGFAEVPGKLQKTHAGTDGPKFLRIPRCIHESNIFKCGHQGGLTSEKGLLITGRYKSMLGKQSPIQVLTPWLTLTIAEPRTELAAISIGLELQFLYDIFNGAGQYLSLWIIIFVKKELVNRISKE